MIAGPGILAARFAKSGSTTLARELHRASLTEGDPQPGQPTHRGFWTVEHLMATRTPIATLRDPVSWHLSHSFHYIRPDGRWAKGGRDWVPAHGCTAGHVALAQADPGAAGLAPDWRPETWTWQVMPDDDPPRRWCHDRGCGLHTWAYVRMFYPRAMWLLSVDDLLGAANERYPVNVINQGRLGEGLAMVAERFRWPLQPTCERANASASRKGASRWSGDPGDYLTADEIAHIRRRERLVVALHFASAPPAVWWAPRE